MNRLLKNVIHIYADSSAPSDFEYTNENNILIQPNGKPVYGETARRNTFFLGLVKKEISVYLSKNAFVSSPQLYMTMHHEYMHAYFSFYGISVANQGHDIIHKWNYDQAMKWGTPVHYDNQGYFSPNYNTPFPLYEKYGFKLINKLP